MSGGPTARQRFLFFCVFKYIDSCIVCFTSIHAGEGEEGGEIFLSEARGYLGGWSG